MPEELKIGEVVKKEKSETPEQIIEKSYSEKVKEILDKTGGGVIKVVIKRRNIKGQLQYCETLDITNPEMIDNLEEYCAMKGGGGHFEAYVLLDKGQKQIASFDIEGKPKEWVRSEKIYKDFDDEEDYMNNPLKKDLLFERIRAESREEIDLLSRQLEELKLQNQQLLRQLEQEREERRKRELEMERKFWEERLNQIQKTMEQQLIQIKEQQGQTGKTEFAMILENINKTNQEIYTKMMELFKETQKKEDSENLKILQNQVNTLLNKILEFKESKKDIGMDNIMGVFQNLLNMAMEIASSTQPTDAKTKVIETIIDAFKGFLIPQGTQLQSLPEQASQVKQSQPIDLETKKKSAINTILQTIRTSLQAKIPPEQMAELLLSAGEKLIKLGYKSEIMNLYTNPKQAVRNFLISLPEGQGSDKLAYIEQVSDIIEEYLMSAQEQGNESETPQNTENEPE
ncbi:MAG: hypothetical protein QW156_04645 [Candidatus Aenigmatarchaeota archaeon]